MNWPYELQIGWRYTRAGRGGRRNRFISFISGVSMFGIALGVAALIIVLSVMNGFQKEVRERMLSVVAHVELLNDTGEGLPDWRAVADLAKRNAEVAAAAPFVSGQALIARGSDMRGTIVRGIDPALEPTVTPIAEKLAKDGLLERLQAGQWNIILGVEVARQLGVQPTLRQFTLVGVFEAGHYEYDSGLALIHVGDAAKLFRTGTPSGVQLKLRDVQLARQVGAQLQRDLLQAGQAIYVRDWTRTNANWYDAVQVEKRMMGIILTLIVAVAAFNLVSTLVMTVTDKQADIAILRTLGASPRSIMGVFMIQGALAGVIGTLGGLGLGLVIAHNLDVIVPFIEKLLHTTFLPASIYVISHMPSDPQWSDIVPITVTSLILAFVATVYPSWRASRVQPAEALRYE